MVNNDKIDPNEETLQEYLDSLVLKEFAHKKDSPFWKELLESLSEMTVVIPIIEAATGKTLITGDYLTGDEQAFKVVSGVVSLATLGYGAAIAKGGGALAKMFAADILAEVVSGSTVIVCDKAGVPSTVTVALAILLGSTTGMLADKALIKNGIKVTGLDEVDNTIKGGKNSILSYEEAEDIAFSSINGSKKCDTVVLGKYGDGGPTAYTNVAKDMDAQYFQLDNWNELAAKYSDDEIWKINEKFLDIQTSSGREIYLSHNPADFIGDGSFYSREIQYLLDNCYEFVDEGGVWHAVR